MPAVCSGPLPVPGGLQVTCEYMAQQEGVLCEEVLLLSESNDDVCVKVKVHARVMGKVHEHVQILPDDLMLPYGVFCCGFFFFFNKVY